MSVLDKQCIKCSSTDLEYYEEPPDVDWGTNDWLQCNDCGQWQDEEAEGVMTLEQVNNSFEESIKPLVEAKYGRHDFIALREAYSNYTDMLCKDGQITPQQYHEMDNPY